MSMRSADFPTLAARLAHAAHEFARWAAIAQAVDTELPDRVTPVVVGGVSRPTEALVMARADQGITGHLADARAAAIQAVLHAERAVNAVKTAERVFTGRVCANTNVVDDATNGATELVI